MHGLQVVQTVSPFVLFRRGAADTFMYQLGAAFTLDAPGILNQSIAPFALDPNKEVYMKRCTARLSMVNCGLSPVKVTVIHIVAREDIPESRNLFSILETDAPTYQSYDVSVTSGHMFQSLWKIIKTKRKYLQPGRTMSVNLSRNYSPNKPFTGQYQANNVDWNYVKGNQSKIVIVTPIIGFDNANYNAVTNPQALTPVPFCVQTWLKRYFSYYTMDVADTSSIYTVGTGFPTNVAGWNSAGTAYFPGYAVAQDNYIGSAVSARPQPVTQTSPPTVTEDDDSDSQKQKTKNVNNKIKKMQI